ncbi:hypothetical protein [Aequorivita lipolytica]|uniref:Uncharacterized protein n=1 Tax=Aequorivita lipolytica TaxID=153267 RepID=A0A5C6YS94_9FLAO|nr:hypothetical protein [Aequorivita lipolytica]TXD70276.1 hypothetical protein ESV24_03685 [Aequorivita lipolytica]SRX50702.1 hypothetical protein AEQU2_01178 [Aequorivita lipolytica]
MAQQSSEEIDLGYLFKKSNDFFKSIIRGLFLILAFFRKFYIIILVLVLVGFAYGYYKDSNSVTTYNNEIIVIPNFESVDYLYDKVEVINNKIASGDTLYLQNVLDTNFRKLNSIKLEPIVDIYNFVSKSYRNYDVLRLIAEKQDFSEYTEDLSTSKYYKYHRMDVSTTGKESSEKIIEDLLIFLNNNEHFRKYQDVYVENNKFEIQEHYNMISQIDSLLRANSRINNIASNVFINNTTDLFNLIDRKRQLVENLVQLKTEEIDFKLPIKKVSGDYNLESKKFFSISNKIKYPLIFVFLFSLVFFIIYIFKKLNRYGHSH